jgi:hypothetical protein
MGGWWLEDESEIKWGETSRRIRRRRRRRRGRFDNAADKRKEPLASFLLEGVSVSL